MLDSRIEVYRGPEGDEGIDRLGALTAGEGMSGKTRLSTRSLVRREDDRRSTLCMAGIVFVGVKEDEPSDKGL